MSNNNATIPDTKRSFRLFLLALLLAASWVGMNLMFPQLAPTGIPTLITRTIIHILILVGLWFGLSRTAFTNRVRIIVWLSIAIPLTLWFIIIWSLAMQGVFRVSIGVVQSQASLPLTIFLPTIVALIALTRSRRIASLLDAMPASWLIGLQLYRILGGIFFVNWLHGSLSAPFALPAGIGDVLVGLLALPTAIKVASGTEAGRKAGMRWNILGLLDFTIALTMGMMTSPGGPLHIAGIAQTNTQTGTFPTVITPAFTVPVSIILHGLSIWQLRRRTHRVELSGVSTQHQLSA